MAYPTDLPIDTASAGTSTQSSPDHSDRHNVIGSATISLAAKVGVGAGSPTLNRLLTGSGNGTSAWGTQVNNLGLGSAVIGTSTIIGGTVGTAMIGTSTIQGGVANNQVVGSPAITGGTQTGVLINTSTFNTGTIGTPTLIGGTIAVSGTVVPISPGASVVASVGTLADAPSGTITPNAQAQQIVEITLGTTAGNRTFGTPANPRDGQFLGYRIKQNVNNTGTAIWPAIYVFNSNGTPSLGTTSSWNYYGWRYHNTDTKWHFQGNSNGIV